MSTVAINQFLSGYDTPLTGFCSNLHTYALWGGARNEERVGVVPTRSVADQGERR